MKKILLAFDGAQFSEGAFDFARKLNILSPVLLTGVFLPQIDYSTLWSYSAGMSGHVIIPTMENEDVAIVEKNIDRFVTLCQLNGIDHCVHKDFSDFALPGLKKESRFADLVILGSESFYTNIGIANSGSYLKDAMHNAECPVLVVPEKFEFPETTILTYDGSESSVYAIKQFAYLLPELTDNNTILLYVNPESNLTDKKNLEELCARHFPNLTPLKLDMNSKKNFGSWCSEKKSAILVSGAFGRPFLSTAFRKNYDSEVIRDHKLPVFISHH